MKKNKIADDDEAISVIKDGDVMAAAGFVGNGTPEELLIALEKRYLETGKPNRITLLFSSGLGDAKERGLNRLAHKGLFKRVIAGHYGLMPKIGQLALENESETYYQDVSRHTTSEEMRSKLGDEFVKRGLAPSLYETEEEAETRILI